MNKIINIFPTRIEIPQYTMGDCVKLEKSLSVWDPVIFSVVFQCFHYNEEKETLIIPGGFNPKYLEELMPDRVINKGNRTVVAPGRKNYYSLKFPTRNTMQNEAINFLVNSWSPQNFLSLETGGGKTYCAIHYAFKCKSLPLTFVDQESIALQWKERILTFTDIQEEQIFVISGAKSIQTLMQMKQTELKKIKWYIGIHRTFSNYMIDKGEHSLTELFKHIGIGLRMYDEAHVEYKNIFNMDRVYDCESLYITATPSRSNPNEDKVYQNMFSKYAVPRFIGRGENYHNVLIFKYDSSPDISDEIAMKSKYGFDAIKWNKYIMQEDKIHIFKQELRFIIEKVYKTNKHKTAILIKSIDLCDLCYNEMKDFLTEKGLTVGRYHSKVKNKESELEKDVIFTTEKSFGKAIDIPGLSVCINTVPCSSETSVLQIIGRLREIPDKEVFFIDMFDRGFEAQCKQSARRLKIYKNKAKKIYNLK